MMKLRRPCEHDRFEEHGGFRPGVAGSSWMCPGGVFLPDDTLVIERDDPRLLTAWAEWAEQGPLELKHFLDALPVREAE